VNADLLQAALPLILRVHPDMKLLGSGLILPQFFQDKFDETAQKFRKLDGIKFHLNPSSAV